MPSCPPYPPRRTPPSLKQINSRMVQVIPAIIVDPGGPGPGPDAVAYYQIENGAVAAIIEVAKRELYRELIRKCESWKTMAHDCTLQVLRCEQAIYEHHLENDE